jgi:predicted dehydrogenase
MTVNVGAIPITHWTQDAAVGGGRLIGEACHFIDLMRFLSASPIVSVQARRMGDAPGVDVVDDKASITLGFEDGSFGTIMYLANGSASFPKERVEVFSAGRVLQLDNFRKLRGYGWPGFSKLNLWRQDKGQGSCAAAFLQGLQPSKWRSNCVGNEAWPHFAAHGMGTQPAEYRACSGLPFGCAIRHKSVTASAC